MTRTGMWTGVGLGEPGGALAGTTGGTRSTASWSTWVLCALAGAAFSWLDAGVNDLSPTLDRQQLSLGDTVLRFASVLLNSNATWGAVGVLAGWFVVAGCQTAGGAARRGALAGMVTLLSACVSYYLYDVAFGHATFSGVTTDLGRWAVVGVLCGLLFGAFGGLMRRPGGVGLVSSAVVCAGAGLALTVLDNVGARDVAGRSATAALGVGTALVLGASLWRHRSRRAVASA